MQHQVNELRQQQQQDGDVSVNTDGGSRDSSRLQAAMVGLLTCEDSLAAAVGQLNVCQQSRQGLRANQRLINEHIQNFSRAHRVARGQGRTAAGRTGEPIGDAELPLVRPAAAPASSTEAVISGDSPAAGHLGPSATRPASSPAEGDGNGSRGDINSRRVRARTHKVRCHIAFLLPSTHISFVQQKHGIASLCCCKACT